MEKSFIARLTLAVPLRLLTGGLWGLTLGHEHQFQMCMGFCLAGSFCLHFPILSLILAFEMVGWHHQLNGHELGQTPGDGEGQGAPLSCSPWGRKESDPTWD